MMHVACPKKMKNNNQYCEAKIKKVAEKTACRAQQKKQQKITSVAEQKTKATIATCMAGLSSG